MFVPQNELTLLGIRKLGLPGPALKVSPCRSDAKSHGSSALTLLSIIIRLRTTLAGQPTATE
jgi:hypothetical protein